MMSRIGRLTRWKIIDAGARRTFRIGLDMAAFEYRQAQEIRDVFDRHRCRYLFIGKSGAILLGFPDTTQDADLYVEKSFENGRRLVAALRDLGFTILENMAADIERGKDFVQLKNGPFDLDLVFAPDGIERFSDAWTRRVDVEGFPVCSLDDIIASKRISSGKKIWNHCPGWNHFETTCVRKPASSLILMHRSSALHPLQNAVASFCGRSRPPRRPRG